MHVEVSEVRCQGHTMCNMVAPELFKLDDLDGHAFVDSSEIGPELAQAARAGMAACPERAITVQSDADQMEESK